jgi:hypothetical protein
MRLLSGWLALAARNSGCTTMTLVPPLCALAARYPLFLLFSMEAVFLIYHFSFGFLSCFAIQRRMNSRGLGGASSRFVPFSSRSISARIESSRTFLVGVGSGVLDMLRSLRARDTKFGARNAAFKMVSYECGVSRCA